MKRGIESLSIPQKSTKEKIKDYFRGKCPRLYSTIKKIFRKPLCNV